MTVNENDDEEDATLRIERDLSEEITDYDDG